MEERTLQMVAAQLSTAVYANRDIQRSAEIHEIVDIYAEVLTELTTKFGGPDAPGSMHHIGDKS